MVIQLYHINTIFSRKIIAKNNFISFAHSYGSFFMQNYLKKSVLSRVFTTFLNVFSTVFWISVIIAFENMYLAIVSVICAMIHESGHLLYLWLIGKKTSLGAVINGFKISSKDFLSYKEEQAVYLSGPFFNLLSASLLLPFAKNNYVSVFITVSFITAISNLLPIDGYDGYGAIRSFIEERFESNLPIFTLKVCSFCFIFSLCIISLYLIDRIGEGYWIFIVFFTQLTKEILGRHH